MLENVAGGASVMNCRDWNGSCTIRRATLAKGSHVPSEATHDEMKKSQDFAQLSKRRGSAVARRILAADAGQNLAVVANLYRTSARLVLMQLGNRREIPR